MILNPFAVSGLLITITCTVMAVMMFMFGRTRLSRIMALQCVATLFWGWGAYQISVTSNPGMAILWWHVAYIGVVSIPFIFVSLVHELLEIKNAWHRWIEYALALAGAIYLFANIFSDSFIADVHSAFGSIYYLSPNGFYNSFLALFLIAAIYSHALLVRYFFKTSGRQRIKIGYFFTGSVIAFIGGSTSFLPVYGINFYPYYNILVSLYPIIMGYAVMRYGLFNIRVATAQSLTLLLWIFFGARFAFSIGTQDASANGVMLAIVVVIGILLLRSIQKELEALDKLTIANQRLTELDQLKSEFLSFASHQIKSPLTSIKWHAQLISEGAFGTVTQETLNASKEIGNAANHILSLVAEFLDLRKIEEGKMTLRLESTNIPVMIQEIIRDTQIQADHKSLGLTLEDRSRNKTALVDSQKFSQVIRNIIDNAIKYTDKGWIKVVVENEDEKTITISVTDTGHGLSQDLASHLFEQFMHSQDVVKQIEGTGLGLYIAKQITSAHNGTICATSPGPGKGSTFTVKIPIA